MCEVLEEVKNSLSPDTIPSTGKYKVSPRISNNRIKGSWLEDSGLIAFDILNLEYEDLTHKCNFKNSLEHHSPDVLVNYSAIEFKNWNNTFRVTFYKARTQIVSRFLPYWDREKVLIISNPRWDKGVKEWLLALGIRIYELGYFVTREKRDKAIEDIRKILGYSHNTRHNSYNTLNYTGSVEKKAFLGLESYNSKEENRSLETKNSENKGNMPGDTGSPREEKDISNNKTSSPRVTLYDGRENKLEDIQTTLVKSSKRARLEAHIRSLTPSCYLCKQKEYCNILKEEDKIKCLKRRSIQFIRGYNTFNINREDPLLEIGVNAFWQNVREKKSMDLNRRNSGDQSTQERIDEYG